MQQNGITHRICFGLMVVLTQCHIMYTVKENHAPLRAV